MEFPTCMQHYDEHQPNFLLRNEHVSSVIKRVLIRSSGIRGLIETAMKRKTASNPIIISRLLGKWKSCHQHIKI